MRREPLLALGLGLALASVLGAVGWRWLWARAPNEHIRVEVVPPTVFEELRRMAREDEPPPPGWLRASEESELRRYRIPEALARAIYDKGHPGFEFDPLAGTVRSANFELRRKFPEHPRRGFTIRTNSLGLRRDEEVSSERPDLRVLVIGDSHVDGICDNREAFPAQLEQELSRRNPGRSIELLNAAVGGYQPYQYLGALEKRLALEPDVCLLVWFAGNDFQGVVTFGHMYEGTPAGQLEREDQAARDAGIQLDLPLMAQGYTSVQYFARRPEEVPFCQRVTREILLEARLMCAAAGVRLVGCVLPSPCELEWDQEPAHFAELRRILRIDAADVALHRSLTDSLLASLEELGIPAVDLRPALAGPAEDSFWRADMHLSVRGHRKVAGALLGVLAEAPELSR